MTFTVDGALHIKYLSSYAYTVLSLVRKVLIKPVSPKSPLGNQTAKSGVKKQQQK